MITELDLTTRRVRLKPILEPDYKAAMNALTQVRLFLVLDGHDDLAERLWMAHRTFDRRDTPR